MKRSKAITLSDNGALALRQFRVVFNAVRGHFKQVEQESGLGGAQVWALSLIQQSPGVGVSDIATQMDIHQSTASYLVKVLLKKELITLDKSEDDKRVAQLRITPAGKKALKKIPGPVEGVLPDALSQLDDATLKSLTRDLEKLLQVLSADRKSGKVPLAHL